MSLVFTDVRFYTENDVYNFAVDNRPMQDLDANTRVLKAAFENFSGNTMYATATGDWASTTLSLNLEESKGKQFTYRISLWMVEDKTVLSNAAHITRETWEVTGVNQLTGVVTILESFRESTRTLGTGTPVAVAFTAVPNGIQISFSGFSGLNGQIAAKIERLGY